MRGARCAAQGCARGLGGLFLVVIWWLRGCVGEGAGCAVAREGAVECVWTRYVCGCYSSLDRELAIFG